ncbi:hypothetical protein WG922_15915 [Ramlibacter sp. AN1015]|uniref:hypothetical protein n=1 Tax=Ramlibacter sp. AN1015 TaxID=3133428 RepID=UPI0030C0DC77
MSPTTRTLLLGLPALLAGLQAAAQSAAPEQSPTPAASAAYNSAFESYRPFAAEEIQDWRRSNDTVREIGGWRAYAREISGGQGQASPPAQPAAPAEPASAPAPAQQPKAANPHEGHH